MQNNFIKVTKVLGVTLLILAGAFVVVFGEIDDSPGAQFLGLLIIAGGMIVNFKLLRD